MHQEGQEQAAAGTSRPADNLEKYGEPTSIAAAQWETECVRQLAALAVAHYNRLGEDQVRQSWLNSKLS